MTDTANHPGTQENCTRSGLVFVADLDKMCAARFILNNDGLPVEIRIANREPLIVSIARRLGAGMAKREYWTPPPEWTNHVDALGRLLWHLNDPRKSKWRRAYGVRLAARSGE